MRCHGGDPLWHARRRRAQAPHPTTLKTLMNETRRYSAAAAAATAVGIPRVSAPGAPGGERNHLSTTTPARAPGRKRPAPAAETSPPSPGLPLPRPSQQAAGDVPHSTQQETRLAESEPANAARAAGSRGTSASATAGSHGGAPARPPARPPRLEQQPAARRRCIASWCPSSS